MTASDRKADSGPDQRGASYALRSMVGVSSVTRWGFEALVVFALVAQLVAMALPWMGAEGIALTPLAWAGMLLMFLLLWFYVGWLFPFLKARQKLLLIFLKELSYLALLGFFAGLILLLYWLVGN